MNGKVKMDHEDPAIPAPWWVPKLGCSACHTKDHSIEAHGKSIEILKARIENQS